MKILLLEDDILLNAAISTYFTSIGHLMTSVRDGNVCWDILEKEEFDLLVFDINVPNIDGFSLIEKLIYLSLYKIGLLFLNKLLLRQNQNFISK